MSIVIDTEKCLNCGICVENCPGDILYQEELRIAVKYPEECWFCGSCKVGCPQDCISIVFPLEVII
ncbi:MAG: 4Fe-4S dicluster domain-containing protein [Peptococcaceae bacterium]